MIKIVYCNLSVGRGNLGTDVEADVEKRIRAFEAEVNEISEFADAMGWQCLCPIGEVGGIMVAHVTAVHSTGSPVKATVFEKALKDWREKREKTKDSPILRG